MIYADNAATTKLSEAALSAMLPYLREEYGNPSGLYAFAQRQKEVLERCRGEIAKILNCEAREIYFASGGSEADNQALLSLAAAGEKKGKKHIVSTAFEHHAVLHTLRKLQARGCLLYTSSCPRRRKSGAKKFSYSSSKRRPASPSENGSRAS